MHYCGQILGLDSCSLCMLSAIIYNHAVYLIKDKFLDSQSVALHAKVR